MLRSFVCPTFFALLSLLLTGCCDCDTLTPIDGVQLRFNADTITGRGFLRNEVKSVYLVRYSTPDLTQPVDTLRQNFSPNPPLGTKRLQLQYPSQTVYLPALQSNGLPGTSFRLMVPAIGRSYDINNFVIESGVNQSGLCKCTDLERVDLQVDGQVRNAFRQAPLLTR